MTQAVSFAVPSPRHHPLVHLASISFSPSLQSPPKPTSWTRPRASSLPHSKDARRTGARSRRTCSACSRRAPRTTAPPTSCPRSPRSSAATRSSLTLLDVGAGSGSISASFAKIIGPTGGHVTAVDINPAVLERGRNILVDRYGVPAGEDWVSFQTASGHELPFEDDTFDVVHCHQVLAHNKGQSDILREMLRVTKPGGVVAAREGDMETEVFWPPLPGLLKFHNDLEVRIIRGRGASTKSGRELLSWALKANGGDRSKITTSFSAWSYTEPEERKMWATGMVDGALNNPVVRESNIKYGISEADMDEMRDA